MPILKNISRIKKKNYLIPIQIFQRFKYMANPNNFISPDPEKITVSAYNF